MSRIVTYGLGGYCANCDETHAHPLHNIVEVVEQPDPIETDGTWTAPPADPSE